MRAQTPQILIQIASKIPKLLILQDPLQPWQYACKKGNSHAA